MIWYLKLNQIKSITDDLIAQIKSNKFDLSNNLNNPICICLRKIEKQVSHQQQWIMNACKKLSDLCRASHKLYQISNQSFPLNSFWFEKSKNIFWKSIATKKSKSKYGKSNTDLHPLVYLYCVRHLQTIT